MWTYSISSPTVLIYQSIVELLIPSLEARFWSERFDIKSTINITQKSKYESFCLCSGWSCSCQRSGYGNEFSLYTSTSWAILIDNSQDVSSNASSSLFNLPDGYTLVPLSMKGSIEPGGEVMTFNGTVNDIMSQIQAIKNDFKWDDFLPTTPTTRRHKSKRTKSHIICKIPDWPSGSRASLLYGYDYLKKIHQPCEVAGGPRKCASM